MESPPDRAGKAFDSAQFHVVCPGCDERGLQRVVSALPQRLEERLRRDEIGRVKPLGEATIHGCQQLARLGRLALSAPQPGQARGPPQFPRPPAPTARPPQTPPAPTLPRRRRLPPAAPP